MFTNTEAVCSLSSGSPVLVSAWIGHPSWVPATPDRKVHGANMGPIWGRQDPGGPHVGPMNFAIWDTIRLNCLPVGKLALWIPVFKSLSKPSILATMFEMPIFYALVHTHDGLFVHYTISLSPLYKLSPRHWTYACQIYFVECVR